MGNNYGQGYGSELDAPTLPGIGTDPLTGGSYPAPPYPAQQQYPARHPNRRPPLWPGPQAQQPSAQAYDADRTAVMSPRRPIAAPPAPAPVVPVAPRRAALPSPTPRASHAPPRAAYHAPAYQPRPAFRPQGRSLPQLPIAHILLILGVAAMGLALMQPWGVDTQGSPVYVNTFSSAALSAQGVDVGALAFQTAEWLLGAAALLAVALIVTNLITLAFNKALGLIGLSGCASLLFIPVLWGLAALLAGVLLLAAGFGGLGALSELPFVQNHGFADAAVQSAARGYYIWWAGIGLTFVGMLGQLALRRR